MSDSDDVPRGPNVCRQCSYPQLTWTQREQRRQFHHLLRAGYSPEQSKQLMPLCVCCVSELLGADSTLRRGPRLARRAELRGWPEDGG
jgi:hypothetical protein